MLTHPTFDQLHQLGLLGMAGAFGEAAEAQDWATSSRNTVRHQIGTVGDIGSE